MVTRNRKIKGAKYFGPYPKIWAVHDTIDLMIKVFPIRTCSDSSYKKAMQTGKPCFPGQIGKCGGPCSQKVTIAEHRAIVEEFVRFMGSYDRRVITTLASGWRRSRRDGLRAGREVPRPGRRARGRVEKSAVVLRDSVDLDLFVGVAEDELAAARWQLFSVRGGRIRGVRGWVVDKELDISTGDLVEQIVQGNYATSDDVPREVVVSRTPRGRRRAAAVAQRNAVAVGARSSAPAQRGDRAVSPGRPPRTPRRRSCSTRRSGAPTTRPGLRHWQTSRTPSA